MKNEILQIAKKLLLTRGYNAFSYSHISSVLGIKNAAIHYYFPSKADLGIAIIQQERQKFQDWLKQSENLSRRELLEQFLSIIHCRFIQDTNCVFLGGTLQGDFHTLPQKVQSEMQSYLQNLHAWLTELLAQGRRDGDFQFSGEPGEKATMVIAILQGTLQLSRVLGVEMVKNTYHEVRSIFLL